MINKKKKMINLFSITFSNKRLITILNIPKVVKCAFISKIVNQLLILILSLKMYPHNILPLYSSIHTKKYT